MNLANSTMKKSFVSIADFCQNSWTFCEAPSSFCFNCCKVDNAFMKLDLCVVRTALEPCLFE